jgi:hypothetical protein
MGRLPCWSCQWQTSPIHLDDRTRPGDDEVDPPPANATEEAHGPPVDELREDLEVGGAAETGTARRTVRFGYQGPTGTGQPSESQTSSAIRSRADPLVCR